MTVVIQYGKYVWARSRADCHEWVKLPKRKTRSGYKASWRCDDCGSVIHSPDTTYPTHRDEVWWCIETDCRVATARAVMSS